MARTPDTLVEILTSATTTEVHGSVMQHTGEASARTLLAPGRFAHLEEMRGPHDGSLRGYSLVVRIVDNSLTRQGLSDEQRAHMETQFRGVLEPMGGIQPSLQMAVSAIGRDIGLRVDLQYYGLGNPQDLAPVIQPFLQVGQTAAILQ